MNYEKLSFVLFLILNSLPVFADSNPSKQDYNILNPTPRDQMRELITDRPDKTESAYTVDAGHFVHETDILNYTFDNSRGDRTESALVMAPNLKVGLTNRMDLQLVVESFNYVSQKVDGQRSKQSGIGDLTTRLKVNIWGNDGGPTAFALMPYLKFPTNHGNLGNSFIEGGLIAPLAIDVNEDLEICVMSQLDIVHDVKSDGYHAEYVNSATFGHGFTDELAGYAELWSSASSERAPLLTADFGLTYMIVADTQLDIGINVGLTDESDDLNPFIGISQRF